MQKGKTITLILSLLILGFAVFLAIEMGTGHDIRPYFWGIWFVGLLFVVAIGPSIKKIKQQRIELIKEGKAPAYIIKSKRARITIFIIFASIAVLLVLYGVVVLLAGSLF